MNAFLILLNITTTVAVIELKLPRRDELLVIVHNESTQPSHDIYL